MLTTNRKKTFRRIFSYKFGCRKKTLSDFLSSNLRAREKSKRTTVQAESQGHVSHYHELMSRVWPVNAYFLLLHVLHCVVLVTFAREKKEREPLFKQTLKVTFHIITSLWVVFGLSTLISYFAMSANIMQTLIFDVWFLHREQNSGKFESKHQLYY